VLRRTLLTFAITGAALAAAAPAQAHWAARCSTHQTASAELACGRTDTSSARSTLRFWRHHDAPFKAAEVRAHRWLLRYGLRHERLARSRMQPVGRRMTVWSTCYDLRGHTATGAPVGWGVVATDPSVIPTGSHLYVPGYGRATALDTGSAIVGAGIDVWMPTGAQCAAWGRRTVVITIY
jgi:3D (Asp-Asp-Asp) domain-containing protein